jgi:hypothetical protein
MQVAYSLEMLAAVGPPAYQSTWRHIPEECNLNFNRRVILKTLITFMGRVGKITLTVYEMHKIAHL